MELSEHALRDLQRCPFYIGVKVRHWLQAIKEQGLENVRHRSGLHDEPLKSSRAGQRSVRLNRAYRAFYILVAGKSGPYVKVIGVNKHDY